MTCFLHTVQRFQELCWLIFHLKRKRNDEFASPCLTKLKKQDDKIFFIELLEGKLKECTKQGYGTTVFPRIIAGGDFFSHKKGAVISSMAHWKSCSKCILFYYAIKSKNIHIKLTEHGLFKCSKFSSLINFHGLNRH